MWMKHKPRWSTGELETENISDTQSLKLNVMKVRQYLLIPGRITMLMQFFSSAPNTFPTFPSSFCMWRSIWSWHKRNQWDSNETRVCDDKGNTSSCLLCNLAKWCFDWQLSLTSHPSLCSADCRLLSVTPVCVCVHEVMWGGVRAGHTDNFLLPICRATPTAAWALSLHSNSTKHTHVHVTCVFIPSHLLRKHPHWWRRVCVSQHALQVWWCVEWGRTAWRPVAGRHGDDV